MVLTHLFKTNPNIHGDSNVALQLHRDLNKNSVSTIYEEKDKIILKDPNEPKKKTRT